MLLCNPLHERFVLFLESFAACKVAKVVVQPVALVVAELAVAVVQDKLKTQFGKWSGPPSLCLLLAEFCALAGQV